MNEFYVEHLVKKERTTVDYLLKVLMIALTVYSCLLVRRHVALVVIPIVLLVITALVFFNLNVEYEYFYMNGSIEIDRIASKYHRRRVFEMKIYDLDVLAPEGASETQPYRSVKKKNFSSRKTDAHLYEMVVTQGRKKTKVIFEPNEQMVTSMKKIEPKKVLI